MAFEGINWKSFHQQLGLLLLLVNHACYQETTHVLFTVLHFATERPRLHLSQLRRLKKRKTRKDARESGPQLSQLIGPLHLRVLELAQILPMF
jgi:hypothetical protein